MNFVKRAFVVTMALVLAGILPASTYALSSSQLDFFAENNILFYDPDSGSCGYNSVGSYSGTASAGLTELQAGFVDTYHSIAEKLSIGYGLPWETVIAQGILESTAGTSTFARERNNFFGIGAYDSNPDAAFRYDTPEDGWRGYYENIRKTATYRLHGVFTGENITNPYVYAETIKVSGYATDSNYVDKLNSIIPAVENRARESGWMLSAELAVKYPEMLSNAAANAAGSNEIIASDTSVDYSTCNYSVGAGNGNINSTAIGLSWPDRNHAPTDPIQTYRDALLAPNGVGTRRQGDVCSIGGYSCDAFLATVMRYSNVDPNFPCCGSAMQHAYLNNHPELYEKIPNLGNTSNLQPGDIRAKDGHVEIVVRLDTGVYKIASASHCDRTADHGGDYYPGLEFEIFRKR